MKVTWEEKDIKSGRRFGKPNDNEIHIIGYIVPLEGPNVRTAVSLSDGGAWFQGTNAEMAKMLNSNEYLPVEILARK